MNTDLIITTDSPPDKITLSPTTGSFSAPARYSSFSPRRTATTVNHTIDTPSMPELWWSSDNSTWYPAGVSPVDTSSGTPTFQTLDVDAYFGSTSYTVVCSNWTASAATIYYIIRAYSVE